MQREVKLIGIDLAKTIFWVRAEDRFGACLVDKKVSRTKLFETVILLKPEAVAMEACGGSHYWGRRFEAEGIRVLLIPPQYVKPYRIGDKNDRNDTKAICEAAKRPDLKPVRVKSVEHQDLQMLVRVRESLIGNRTQVSNEMRAFLAEHGYCFGLGMAKAIAGARELLSVNNLTETQTLYLNHALEKLSALNKEIKLFDTKIKLISKTDPVCKLVQTLAGIGPVTAVALRSTVVNPLDYRNGRQFSAFLGLVPKQSSSGGKTRLLGMGKDGNRYVRQLLIHGSRSVLKVAPNKTDSTSLWVMKKRKERGFNKACVALANKNARQIWALMAKNARKELAA